LKNPLNIKKLLPAVFSILLFSCTDDRFYEVNLPVANSEWYADDVKKFEVEITDTLAKYDFFINVRNTGAYQYANLFLFINTTFPDEKVSRDTVEIILAEPSGRWLGKGSGSVYDNRVLFKRNVIFPASGVYTFELEQAMRTRVLPEIMDVGLRIEKKEEHNNN
jgi:gliding motility-associated lipoprotein GldH